MSLDERQAKDAVEKYMSFRVPEIVNLIREWCTKAHAPELFDDQAAYSVAAIVRTALGNSWWRDELAAERERHPDLVRMREIAEDLRRLQANLPTYIHLCFGNSPPVPVELTVKLFDLVRRHQPLIDAVQPRGRGRQRSQERDLTTVLSQKALEQGADAAAADAFANEAIKWLTGRDVPAVKDDAVRKARTNQSRK
jgi:hypothetical protein